MEDHNISDDTKSLLIEVQRLVKSLEDAYREAVMQGDKERKLLLYQEAVPCRTSIRICLLAFHRFQPGLQELPLPQLLPA